MHSRFCGDHRKFNSELTQSHIFHKVIPDEKIDDLIQKSGFEIHRWIDSSKIVVAQWVRVKCTFGCSDYGLGTCPPNSPSVEDCRSFFSEYKKAVIIPLITYADKNDYPSAWSRNMTIKLLMLEKDIFLSGYQKTFLLNQTCCTLCKECPGNRLECKDKTHSRPSPESFAVDVYQTVRNAGMEIHVVSENPSEIKRIAILLIE